MMPCSHEEAKIPTIMSFQQFLVQHVGHYVAVQEHLPLKLLYFADGRDVRVLGVGAHDAATQEEGEH